MFGSLNTSHRTVGGFSEAVSFVHVEGILHGVHSENVERRLHPHIFFQASSHCSIHPEEPRKYTKLLV